MTLAHQLVTSGRPVDLSGLELETGGVCAAALDLDPIDRHQVRGRLVTLLQRLDRLATAISGERMPW